MSPKRNLSNERRETRVRRNYNSSNRRRGRPDYEVFDAAEDQGRRAAYAWAASYMDGEEKTAMLAKAVSGRKNKKKAKEEENLSM